MKKSLNTTTGKASTKMSDFSEDNYGQDTANCIKNIRNFDVSRIKQLVTHVKRVHNLDEIEVPNEMANSQPARARFDFSAVKLD